MRTPFIGIYNPTIVLTYIGAYISIVGIGLMFTDVGHDKVRVMSAVMILLSISGICDLFDGRVASMFDRNDLEKRFGIQLDSMVDTVSFVVLPSLAILFVTGLSWHSILVISFYSFAGIMRLSFSNAMSHEGRDYFLGMPVTFVSVVFPIITLVSVLTDPAIMAPLFELGGVVTGTLFILRIRFNRVKLLGALIWSSASLVTIALLLLRLVQ